MRYYERIGLMPRPSRTSGGHRSYDEKQVRQLSFIRRARELGFSIEDIRALLMLAAPAQRSCAEVKEIASAHLISVQAKLADLTKLENILTTTVAQCSGEPFSACPLLDILDRPQPS